MRLVDKFHKMESENFLFDLGKEIDFPIWDIIRYNVYIKYYYPKADTQRLEKHHSHPISHYFSLLMEIAKSIFIILFKKGEVIFVTISRYKAKSGVYFDKSAHQMIQLISKKCITIEQTFNPRQAYTNIYDFSYVLAKLTGYSLVSKKNTLAYFEQLDKILIEYLGENLFSFDEMHKIINQYKSTYYFYKLIFYLKKTKKIFIATGNRKALIKAAKERNITTYLMQHAGIEFDEIDFSYPPDISYKSNILYSDYLLTFGKYWCKNINVPVKKIFVTGNDFFYSKSQIETDNSILVVSSIVHGRELSLLTKQFANCRTDLKFVYKLHPAEFNYVGDYLDFFLENPNVIVITDQVDTNILIAKCQLVVLIVSAVLYEALNQNKKVAVYKKINYERQLSLAHLPNIYFFEDPNEVFDFLIKNVIHNDVQFYEPSNLSLINQILFE